jgi:hypothetical protein
MNKDQMKYLKEYLKVLNEEKDHLKLDLSKQVEDKNQHDLIFSNIKFFLKRRSLLNTKVSIVEWKIKNQ